MKTLKSLKILIIEDNIDTLNLLKFTFSSITKNITTAQNGVEAYKILYNTDRDNQFDYIIMCLRLPDENGIEIIKLIKLFFTSKIVVYTAYKEFKDKCRYDFFFEKEKSSPSDILDVIKKDSKN